MGISGMQEETCWLLSHSSDFQIKIYTIYLVGVLPLTRELSQLFGEPL